MDLKKAKEGEEFTLKISEDTAAVGAKITDLVAKINGVLGFIKSQNTMDEKTDTSRTLGGDIMLQSLEGRIHSAVFKDVFTDKGYKRAGDLGMSFNRQGMMDFDENKFQSMLDKDYNNVAQILTGTFGEDGKTEGFMDNLSGMVNMALRIPDGLVQSRRKTLSSNIEQIDRRIAQKTKYIEEKEKSLKDKFARLEGTISKIRSSGAGLQGMADPVQQLG